MRQSQRSPPATNAPVGHGGIVAMGFVDLPRGHRPEDNSLLHRGAAAPVAPRSGKGPLPGPVVDAVGSGGREVRVGNPGQNHPRPSRPPGLPEHCPQDSFRLDSPDIVSDREIPHGLDPDRFPQGGPPLADRSLCPGTEIPHPRPGSVLRDEPGPAPSWSTSIPTLPDTGPPAWRFERSSEPWFPPKFPDEGLDQPRGAMLHA